MALSQALLLGILQGMTEFLPISSSGHLSLAQIYFGDLATPPLLFDVVVHMGTLTAIVVSLWPRVLGLGRAAVRLVVVPSEKSVERRWLGLIVVASIPTAIVGLALEPSTRAMMQVPAQVGAALLATAGVLLLCEWMGTRTRGSGDIGVVDAMLIGLAQGLAVLPGLSRSGATIGTALWRNVDGDVAVDFSLLISIPAVSGATLLVVIENAGQLSQEHLAPLAVGFVAALVSGAGALRLLRWVVTQRRLRLFAAYCGVVGMGAIVLG